MYEDENLGHATKYDLLGSDDAAAHSIVVKYCLRRSAKSHLRRNSNDLYPVEFTVTEMTGMLVNTEESLQVCVLLVPMGAAFALVHRHVSLAPAQWYQKMNTVGHHCDSIVTNPKETKSSVGHVLMIL